MSSLALMRWLEAAPERYDAGMRLITLGRVDRVRDALVESLAVEKGDRVLEIGCGTGAVTERLVRQGARVTAIDSNPEMIRQAKRRLAAVGSADLEELTAAEIDRLPAASFDAVVSAFAFSEMSATERAFVLRHALRCLKGGGLLGVADEVKPQPLWACALHAALRFPQAAVGWLIAGNVSRPLRDLGAEIEAVGFRNTRSQRFLAGSLAVFIAERPE